MRDKTFRGRLALVVAVLTWVGLSAASTASAFVVELGEDSKIDCSVSLTYGAGWRLKDPDKKLISDTTASAVNVALLNADDGNRNFKKWDMMNNRVSALIDMDLQYKDYGAFVRPRVYFDWAYDGSNANDDPLSNNNMSFYGGPLSSTDEFTSDTQDLHRDKAEILDAFVYGTFKPGGHDSSLRIGRQVVRWGESLFLQNSISSAMAPLDATAANVPGVELKDIFLPVEQVSGQIDLTSNLALAGFYQWRWDKTRINEAGSYFSTSDLVDDAGERFLFPVKLTGPVPFPLAATVDRTSDKDPSDSGQWGVALRYVAEALGDTEFGLYYINYHEKLPMVNWQLGGGTPSAGMLLGGGSWAPIVGNPGKGALLNAVDTSSYFLSYAEDVKLMGVSASGVLGETNVAAEISYRQDIPVQIVAPFNPATGTGSLFGFEWQDADILQAQVSAIHLFGEGWLWDNLTLMGEVGFNRVYDEGSAALKNDKSAWGFTAQTAFDYFQILDGLDLKVPVTLKMNPNGVSSAAGTFAEDQDSVAIKFDFTYKSVYQFGIAYTDFLHGANKNPLADRDFISATLKYTF